MDKLFGRHRNEESDEKPSDDITDPAGGDNTYSSGVYGQKTSKNSDTYGGSVGYDGDDYTKKSSDTIDGDESSDRVGEAEGDLSEKVSGDDGFGGSDEYGGSEKTNYAPGRGEKVSYDTGDGGFGGRDEDSGLEKSNYASGGGDGGVDFSSEKTSDAFGSVGKGGYEGDDYSTEKTSRGAEESVGDYE